MISVFESKVHILLSGRSKSKVSLIDSFGIRAVRLSRACERVSICVFITIRRYQFRICTLFATAWYFLSVFYACAKQYGSRLLFFSLFLFPLVARNKIVCIDVRIDFYLFTVRFVCLRCLNVRVRLRAQSWSYIHTIAIHLDLLHIHLCHIAPLKRNQNSWFECDTRRLNRIDCQYPNVCACAHRIVYSSRCVFTYIDFDSTVFTRCTNRQTSVRDLIAPERERKRERLFENAIIATTRDCICFGR